ncbi:2OG-Fe(II) oxygenase [Insolitispirillum peregrinum]|uniref:2OG-Fe(II) oxygenase n=1 Tax=Insolitispirillum peregrinum TaxID=80876 RepID=UPI0036147A38
MSLLGAPHGAKRGAIPAPLWLGYPEAFSPEECASLIDMMIFGTHKSAGLVNGKAEQSIRQTDIHWIPENDETSWVYQRLAQLVAQGNRDAFGYTLSGFDEDAQIGRYQNGGFYDWHIDRGGRGIGARRKLTVSVQLSDPADYQGGELQLNPDGRVVTAETAIGTAVVFPAYMLHRVAPVTQGVRHSLVIWTHGPDFT